MIQKDKKSVMEEFDNIIELSKRLNLNLSNIDKKIANNRYQNTLIEQIPFKVSEKFVIIGLLVIVSKLFKALPPFI